MNTFFASAMAWARSVAITLSCLLVLLTATPALANSSAPSSPEQGTAPLNGIYDEAEKAVQPENALNGDKMIDRANQGLNEVQKNADVNQMSTPANSGQATSPIDKIKNALSKMTK